MNEIEKAIETITIIHEHIDLECDLNEDLDECFPIVISALEKQMPKKPIRVSNNRTDGCPICKTEYYERFKHCPECGIKLDWSVESFEI